MTQWQNHVLRVPQIDLAAVLAEQHPQIDLRITSYETSARSFLKAVANYKTRTIATIADKRSAHAAEKKYAIERIGNVETETNQCKIKEIELVAGTTTCAFSAAALTRYPLHRLATRARGKKGG